MLIFALLRVLDLLRAVICQFERPRHFSYVTKYLASRLLWRAHAESYSSHLNRYTWGQHPSIPGTVSGGGWFPSELLLHFSMSMDKPDCLLCFLQLKWYLAALTLDRVPFVKSARPVFRSTSPECHKKDSKGGPPSHLYEPDHLSR